MYNPETPEDKTPIRVLWKGNSKVLGCRLVIGISDEFVSPEDIVSVAVTSYPTEDTEGKLIDSFVIELKASKLIDMMGAETFLSYIEGAAMAKEEYMSKAVEGYICKH